jgi:hypothetical protein
VIAMVITATQNMSPRETIDIYIVRILTILVLFHNHHRFTWFSFQIQHVQKEAIISVNRVANNMLLSRTNMRIRVVV